MAASEVPHDIADMVNEWKVSEDPGYWETGSDWVVSEETGVDVSFKPIDNYTAEFVDKLPISEGEKKLLRSHISLVNQLETVCQFGASPAFGAGIWGSPGMT